MFIVVSACVKIIETLNDVVGHLKILVMQEVANTARTTGRNQRRWKTIQRINGRKVDSLKNKYDWQVLAKLIQGKGRPKFIILAIENRY